MQKPLWASDMCTVQIVSITPYYLKAADFRWPPLWELSAEDGTQCLWSCLWSACGSASGHILPMTFSNTCLWHSPALRLCVNLLILWASISMLKWKKQYPYLPNCVIAQAEICLAELMRIKEFSAWYNKNSIREGIAIMSVDTAQCPVFSA